MFPLITSDAYGKNALYFAYALLKTLLNILYNDVKAVVVPQRIMKFNSSNLKMLYHNKQLEDSNN